VNQMVDLRVAIVGAGLMGHWHGHSAKRVGAQVVAIVDSNLTAAQLMAKHEPTAQVFADLESSLKICPVDVVHICTPLNSHAGLIEAALKAECHVLAEKPLAFSLKETETLINLAVDRGLKLNPVHQFPFQSGFLKVLAQRSQLGEIVRFAYTTCSAGGTNQSGDARRSVLLEILPHPVALLCHLFGDAFNPEFLQVVHLTGDDLELVGEWHDTRINVIMSLRGRPTCNELQLVGTKATAYIDLYHGYGILEPGQVSRQAKITKPFRLGTQILTNAGSNLIHRSLRAEPAYPGLRELIKRFYQSIASDTPPPISNAEIFAAAHLIDQVRTKSMLI
jgi:predicted dehydrogenase